MKTLILKKSELDRLSENAQNEITKIFKETENTIVSLKKRIADLKHRIIDYRYDTNKIELDNLKELKENLYFDIWEKTAGEQWGNCAGTKYTFRLGTKYIRIDLENYHTDRMDYDSSEYISNSKMSEILDLLEEAFLSDEVDGDHLASIAANRIKNLFDRY